MIRYLSTSTWIIIGVVIGVAVIASAAYFMSGLSPNKRIVELAEKSIEARLLDPSSAQMEILQSGRVTSDRSFVCGTVNAKNAYGGYTGARPFIVTFDGVPPNEQPDISKVAGQDWHACEGCREFDDYYADDSSRIRALCEAFAQKSE